VEHNKVLEGGELTLAPTPTEPYPAASDRETLHLLDRAFRVSLSHELDKPAMLPNRYLNLMDVV
jgi:hypothetical protein